MAKKRNSNDLSSPRSRTERYLAKIAGLSDSMPTSPFSRLERYLEAIALRSSGVGSFNGRTGAVVPENGDYTAQMVGALPIYGGGRNLLDNWYFGNADSIIDQRGGYVLTDTATYYTDTALTQNPVTVNEYTTVYYPDVHSAYIGFYLTDDPTGTEYYASTTDCVRGYVGNGYTIDRWKYVNASNSSVLIKPDCIALNITSGLTANSCTYSQVLTMPFVEGGKITASILVKSASGNLNARLRFADAASAYIGAGTFGNLATGLNLITTTIPVGTKTISMEFRNTNTLACAAEIHGVFVEEGFIQTGFINLGTDVNPVWVPSSIPLPTLELLKCQRYYHTYETEAMRPSKALDCVPVMRIDPKQKTIGAWGKTLYANDANL